MARATPGTWLRMLSQISREPAPPPPPVLQAQAPPLLPQSQTTGAQPEPVRPPRPQPQSTATLTTPVSMPTPQPEAAPTNPPLPESQTAPEERQSIPQPQATPQPSVSQAFPQSQTAASQPPPARFPVPQAQDTMSPPVPQPETVAPQPPTARPPAPQPRETSPLSQIAPSPSTPVRPSVPQTQETTQPRINPLLPQSQAASLQPTTRQLVPQSQEASESPPRSQLVAPQPPTVRLPVPQPQDTMQPQVITWPPAPQRETSAPQPPIQTQPRPSTATRGTAPPSITIVVPEDQKPSETLNLASRSPPPSESPRIIKTSFPTPSLTTRQLQPIADLEHGTNQQNLQPKRISVQEEAINCPIETQPPATATAKTHTDKEDMNIAADARKGPRKTTERKKEETELTIITISGGNVGAHMELGSPPSRHHSHNSMKQRDQSGRDGESHSLKGTSEVKQGKKSDRVAPNAKPIESRVNSNVQNINNSIFLNASCTVGNPGVHVTLFRNRTRPRKPTSPSKKTSNDTC